MKRGEVWTVAGGPDYAGKPRPAVVLQNDFRPGIKSATVCMFTTDPSNTPIARPLVDPDGSNGISNQSRLMVDKIATVPQRKMKSKIGDLGETDMVALNRAVIDFLGLVDSPANSF